MRTLLVSINFLGLLSLLLPAVTVWADANTELDLFCTDPVEYVCGQPLDQTPAEIEFETMRLSADQWVDQRLGYAEGVFTEKNSLSLMFSHPDINPFQLLAAHVKRFISIANAAAYNQTGRVPHPEFQIPRAFQLAKLRALALITKLHHQDLGNAIATISSLRLLTPADFAPSPDRIYHPETSTYTFEKNPARTANPAADPHLESYLKMCGSFVNLKRPFSNAAYLPGKGVFYVCPGDFVDMALRASDPDVLIEMEWNFAHEMAHAYYSEITYLPIIECIADEAMSAISPNHVIQTRLAYKMADEYIADLFANQAMVERLRQIREKTKAETTLRRLHASRRALRDLCNSEGASGHPDGATRIEQIFRRDPEISAAIGCTKTTKEPRYACTLTGRSAEKY